MNDSYRLPPEPGNLIERSMLKNAPEEQRDRRDFEAIVAWSQGIARELGRLGYEPKPEAGVEPATS